MHAVAVGRGGKSVELHGKNACESGAGCSAHAAGRHPHTLLQGVTLFSFRTAKIHCTHPRGVACVAVPQGGNEGEKEQKEKNIRGGIS